MSTNSTLHADELLHTFRGSCHCGTIRFTYQTTLQPEQWSVRACQCSFCRSHGAQTTSDPNGSVAFLVTDQRYLQRYQFGTGSADFFICRVCGVYVAAVMDSPRGQFATINVNTIRDVPERTIVTAMTYEGETSEQRRARRLQRWTPLASPL